MDIAKRLIDYNVHSPTVYFPLIVPEAMMIEPTETESRETIESFARTLRAIAEEDPDYLHDAPHTTPVSRPDEVKAAKSPVLQLEAAGRTDDLKRGLNDRTARDKCPCPRLDRRCARRHDR